MAVDTKFLFAFFIASFLILFAIYMVDDVAHKEARLVEPPSEIFNVNQNDDIESGLEVIHSLPEVNRTRLESSSVEGVSAVYFGD